MAEWDFAASANGLEGAPGIEPAISVALARFVGQPATLATGKILLSGGQVEDSTTTLTGLMVDDREALEPWTDNRILAFIAMKMEISWRSAPFRNSALPRLEPFAGYFTQES
jgi:hypothetical protein